MTSRHAAIAALVCCVAAVARAIPGEARDRFATSRSLAPLGMRVPAWKFASLVSAVPVTGLDGKPMPAPFLGGFDVPRPQLVDINGDGHPELFIQERSGEIMEFQHVGDQWVWRTNRYQDLDVGEWFRFVDVDADGRIDLLGEMQTGYIRMWKNVGTRSAARFVAFGDTIRDVDGRAILADRQNILNAVDIDCNGKLDLFIGRVQGIVDRFEQEGSSPDGTPRFRLIEEGWQGIQVLGPEATGAPLYQRSDTTSAGPRELSPAGSSRHGANTLTFADIDGKGTLDLFWGDFFEPGLLRFPNTGTCAQPNLQEHREQFPAGHPVYTSGYNAPTFGDVDGDGNLDLVMGVIGGAYQPRTTAVDNLYLIQQAPKGTWTVRTKRLIPTIDVGSEAMPVLGDLHGDGRLDLLVGNKISPTDETTGSVTWFENVGTRTSPAFVERGPLPIRGEFNYAPAVVDLNGDGLPDIVVGTWRDRIAWYRNTGTHAAPAWTLADSALVTITRGSNTAPTFGDIDGDGLPDLVIGAASGRLNVYRNTGTRSLPKFQLVSDHFQDIKVGRRSTPVLVDLDGDGKLDLLIGNEEGDLQLWLNAGSAGEFRFVQDTTFHLNSYHNAAPAVGDLHGSGHLDILVGTDAGGIRWFENETRKP